MIKEGTTAPAFKTTDADGETVNLKELKGQKVVLYFYPKDDTPGCTKEACSFRDASAAYKEKGIEVVGVSKDSVKSHKKFAEKYHLQFTLLSDESKAVIQAFGAWGVKKFMGKEYEGTKRNSYLINPEGEIAKSYENVNPLTHSTEILRDFEAISASAT